MREGRFFEAASGISTTPVYVKNGTTKTTDTSSWTQITSTNLSVTEPANTALRYLFSFDGQTTWKAFSGGAWVTRTLTDIENSGMTSAEVSALSAANWNVSGGLNSSSNTLDLAVSLHSTTGTATPTFNSLTFNVSETYWEEGDSATVTTRLYGPTSTGITNLQGITKNFKINFILP